MCSCHATYAFQSESTFYSCLNNKELLSQSRQEIWRLSDCNWTRTQNYLVRKRTLSHLAILSLLRARSSLTFRQLKSVDSLWNAYITWQEHTVKCTILNTEHSSIIWQVSPNGWVFVYELSGSGFESSCNHLNIMKFGTNLKNNIKHKIS